MIWRFLSRNLSMIMSFTKLKINVKWLIINFLRTRWTKIWLSIIMFSILFYILNFWISSQLEYAKIMDAKYSVNQRPLYSYWGKDRTDYNWLVRFMELRRSDIPTFVIEEHYEVLKYWFQAAELGLISKSRNVLLHIDGHIDIAFPENAESIPWFRFPRDEDEIHNMMQRNDMFIAGAAITGLIDHVIWVWPTWIASNNEEEDDYTYAVFDVFIGYTQVYSSKSGAYDNDLCVCVKKQSSTEDGNATHEWNCRRKNKLIITMENGLKIKKSECLRQVNGILEVVSESLAPSVLAKQKWPRGKQLLLDIDEDYFGRWSDIISLYDIGFTQKNIDLLSELVSYLFCVNTAEEEQLVDSFYVSLLFLMKDLKSKSCANEMFRGPTKCLRNVEIENFIIDNMDRIKTFLDTKGLSQLLCESGEKVNGLFFQSLTHFLLNFSLDQLDALSMIGICLEVSPPSIHFSTSGKFHVCHGDNVPNKTEVKFYMPSIGDINFHAVKLKRILTSITLRPDIISVCRSVRDGYTPKSHFNLIEKIVMKSIHSVYRQSKREDVHYDQNLLGGRSGWSSRSQPLVSELLRFLALN